MTKKLSVTNPTILGQYSNADQDAVHQNSSKKYDKSGRLILDESIYGPSGNASFDLTTEVQEFKDNNIIDDAWASTNTKETTVMTAPQKTTKKKDALKAAGFTPPTAPAEPTPVFDAPSQEPEGTVEEKKEEVPLTPEETMQMLAEELAARFDTGAPSVNIIKQWKSLHGNIFVLDLGGEDFFLYRYLKRQEYNQILANPQWNSMRKDQQDDIISDKCLLWPRVAPEQAGMIPAGRNEMIAEQVRLQSMFLNPAQIANVTIKI